METCGTWEKHQNYWKLGTTSCFLEWVDPKIIQNWNNIGMIMEFYGGKQQDDNGDILESNETRFSFFFLRLLSRPGIPRYHPSGISHVHGTPMVPMAPPQNLAKHPLLSVESPMKIRVEKTNKDMRKWFLEFSTNKDMRMQEFLSQGWAMNGYPPAGAWLAGKSQPSIWFDEFPSSHVWVLEGTVNDTKWYQRIWNYIKWY